MWPVIQRELREGARRPFNYWLRVGAAGGALGVLMIIYSAFEMPAGSGIKAFTRLHTLLLLLIWWVVPAMACDCIAREKRDGTLGLLFMTPLSAGGIVAGKSLVQGFRAFTLWLAVIPVLTIPFLMGGIGWLDLSTVASFEFSATVLCLAAGLLASSLVKNRMAAFFMAAALATFFLLLISVLAIFMVNYLTMAAFWAPGDSDFVICMLTGIFPHNFNATDGWAVFFSSGNSSAASSAHRFWCYMLIGVVGLSLAILISVTSFASACVRRSWKDKIPSVRQAGLIKRFCTPLLQRRFSKKMQGTMDRNPIAWLQQYSWKARLSKWGLCFGFVIGETLVVTANVERPDNLLSWQIVFLFVLGVVFTFIGINSFLMEKQSGALELILITPLRVGQIIFGRAWGLWKLFLPAALILGASTVTSYWLNNARHYYFYGRNDFEDPVFQITFAVVAAFFNLPVFATYFALRVKNLIVAGVLTWIALLIAPYIGLGLVAIPCRLFSVDYQSSNIFIFMGIFLGNAAFAALVCFLLRHSLSRRIYSF